MSVGKALLQIRRDQGLTQRAVGDRAGLAVSYVSRVENNHVQPTMGMLARIAAALEVSVASIFQVGERACTTSHKCPVSTSGNCIGELIRNQCGRVPNGGKVHYGEDELQLLKMADYVTLHGSKELRQALTTVLESFMLQVGAEADTDSTLPVREPSHNAQRSALKELR